MASLYVSYFGTIEYSIASEPVSSEVVTTSATSATTATTVKGALCKIQSDTPHYIKTGVTPVAAAGTGIYIASDEVLWLRVRDTHKIAAILA